MHADAKNASVTADQIRSQCDRILASRIFSRSKRQCDFLKYVVDSALAGREDKLKEFTLGLDVFEKDETFDPNVDSIVRVEASRLRAKLREYYSELSAADDVKIEIPKGHYIPVFTPIGEPDAQSRIPSKKQFLNRKSDLIIIALIATAIGYYVLEQNVLAPMRAQNTDEVVSQSARQAENSERSIAVLPFRNNSAKAEDAYFVDGIHDDILTQLTNLTSLDKVISRTSMEQYRDTTKSSFVIGEELGVAILLEGSVQRAGDRVRINVQLIDAINDQHIWTSTFDRELTASGIFAIQSEIALAIADALHATLSPAERAAIASVPTTDLQAYDLYQQAQQLRRTLGLGSRNEVAQLLEQAIDIDPDFALAHLALARAHIDRYFTREGDKSHRDLARVAIDRAFELSPGMPATRIALADYYYKGFLDYGRALEQLAFAIPLAPGNSEAFAIRAFILRRRGDFDAAIPDLVRAIELDPGNFSPHYVLANTYVILYKYAQAIPYYDKAIALAPRNFGLKILRAYALTSLDANATAIGDLTRHPAFSDGSSAVEIAYRWEVALMERNYDLAMNAIDSHQADAVIRRYAYYPLALMRGLTELQIGDPGKAVDYFVSARATLEALVTEMPDDPRIHSALGFAYAGLNEGDQAIAAANTASELYPVSADAVGGTLYLLNMAKTYAMLGEHDAAIRMLGELWSQPSDWYATPNIILRSPIFEELQDDPTFIALLENSGSR